MEHYFRTNIFLGTDEHKMFGNNKKAVSYDHIEFSCSISICFLGISLFAKTNITNAKLTKNFIRSNFISFCLLPRQYHKLLFSTCVISFLPTGFSGSILTEESTAWSRVPRLVDLCSFPLRPVCSDLCTTQVSLCYHFDPQNLNSS